MPKTKAAKKRNKIPAGFIAEDVPSPLGNGTDRVIRRAVNGTILYMYRRRTLTEAEFMAACKFEEAHIISQGRDRGSIDLSVDKVDTSGIVEPLQEYQIHAMDVIAQATMCLDLEGLLRVEKIVGDGLTVKEYCIAMHKKSYNAFQTQQSNLLKKNLCELAILWGYESKGRKVA